MGQSTSTISKLIDIKFAALIGSDILSRFDVRIDIGKGQLTLSEDPLKIKGIKEPLEYPRDNVPVLNLKIEGKGHRFIIDTGAKLSHIKTSIAKRYKITGKDTGFFPSFGNFETEIGEINVTIAGRDLTLTFGTLPEILKMTLDFSTADGIIGKEIFDHFNIVEFKKNKPLYQESFFIQNKTILDIINISENDRDVIWRAFESIRWSSLDIPPNDWHRLAKYCIYEEDSLETFLSLSLEYIGTIWYEDAKFIKIFDTIIILIQNIVGHNIRLHPPHACSNNEIFSVMYSDFLDGLSISSSCIPQNLLDRLHYYGISKWNELSDLSEENIISRFGFDKDVIILLNSLLSSYSLIIETFEIKNTAMGQKENWASFELMIKAWISCASYKETAIVMNRMGWCNDVPKTLEQIANEYGLSRERIRQIETKVLRKIMCRTSLERLLPLWIIIDSFLQSSGVLKISELAEKLQIHFQWEQKPTDTALMNLISFWSPEFYADEFTKDCSSEKLFEALKNDSLPIGGNTIADLNKLLELRDLYVKVTGINTKQPFSIHLQEFKQIYEKTRHKSDLKKLNRALLEEFYPRECPKKLSFRSKYTFNENIQNNNVFLVSRTFTCISCKDIGSKLIDLISEVGVLDIPDTLKKINIFCENACLKRNRYIQLGESFIHFLILNNEEVKDSIKIKGNKLYSNDTWTFHYGRLLATAESILKISGRAMHFKEIFEEIKKIRPNNNSFTERNIHAALDRSQNVLLWDRGTFLHVKHAPFPYGLIRDVEDWVEEKLNDGQPFFSVSGVFSFFKNKCIAENITSETALYSCLRLSADPRLSYPHYPYIYLSNSTNREYSAYSAIELFMQEAGEPVPLDDLRKYFLDNLGLKEFQMMQSLDKNANILRIDRGHYLHADYLNINKDKLPEIISHIKTVISSEGHVSVHKIFKDKKIVCIMSGIANPLMLFSVLRFYESNEFQLNRFPQIRAVDISQESITDMVVKFVKDSKPFCTFQDLHEYFIMKLGYSEQSPYSSVSKRDDIYRYLQGCLVHKDTIGLTEENQNKIEAVAINVYFEGIKTGQYYGLISDIIESDELPQLDNELYWTELLLADVMNNNNKVKVLGNKKNAFVPVPNDYNIESFEDLLYEILKNKYHGAANLDEFNEALVDMGIIIKRVTNNMLGTSKKVSIIEQQIILTELLRNA